MADGALGNRAAVASDPAYDAEGLALLVERTRERCTTAQEIALEALREAILEGVLPAGARLRQEDLASVFKTSRIPIREALRALEYEGLVESEPHRGFTVAGFDADQIEEVYDLRSVLERYAVREAVPLLTAADIAELAELFEAVQTAPDAESRMARGEQWMVRLFSVTARPELLRLIVSLRKKVPPGLRSKLVQHAPHNHRAFFDAVKQGDAEGAAAELGAHYQKQTALLRRFLREAKQTQAASRRLVGN